MEDRIVKYILEDPSPNSQGFYLVSSEKYDDNITISHTHQGIDKIGKIFLEREVEPGIFKCFDMLIDKVNKQSTN